MKTRTLTLIKGLVGPGCTYPIHLCPQAHGKIVQRRTKEAMGRVECMSCDWAGIWCPPGVSNSWRVEAGL